MLLISDIHINSHFSDRILSQLQNFVTSYPAEQNIIFLWDFVYHFAYDRGAMLDLYDFFVSLYSQGKNLYILAWNHDRLGQHFVYAEAQKAFEIINNVSPQDSVVLRFITKPELIKIEWEQILFLPYVLQLDNSNIDIETNRSKAQENGNLRKLQIQIDGLKTSKNKHEQFSAQLNELVLDYVASHPKLTIIHHYYIHKTKFPWQKARFSFKDIALSETLLDYKDIKLISGHLHQAFVYQNYCCLWSVWYTSSLENNQAKYLASYDTTQNKISLEQISINPYILLEYETQTSDLFGDQQQSSQQIGLPQIQEQRKQIQQDMMTNFQDQSVRKLAVHHQKEFDLKSISLTVRTNDLDYNRIDEFVSPTLRHQVKDVKLKKQATNIQDLIQWFDLESKNLSTWFSDRKDILNTHIQNKFQEDVSKYQSMIQELKLI